jgi:4-amino-4-deoxy-L-arabinose transferase-like glycosyltransferase
MRAVRASDRTATEEQETAERRTSNAAFQCGISSEFDVGRSTLDVRRSAVARLRPLLIVLGVWAAIYLPALGTLEIKGEEGRRILPAVTMLETGNYIVPYVGGVPYERKPPLVNWLVAGSFKLFGARNEWTARLPSTLCVLAVALTFLTVARPSLGANGSLFAALMWLTNFGMIEKGRLIEIEALYVSLFGLATICWLSWWQQRRSPWLTWIVPWIFLGLGLLAKGPLLLLFFYAIVTAVLWRRGGLRQLWHPAHVLGIALMLAIFAAWAVPYLQMATADDTAQVWSRQVIGRLGVDDFKLGGWIRNFPRAIGYGLPWAVLLLFLPSAFRLPQTGQLARGIAWGAAIPFLFVNLLPSALPRYTMPLLIPAIWLLALTLTAPNLIALRGLRLDKFVPASRSRLVIGVAVATAVAMCIYAVAIVPFLRPRQKVRNIAAQIEAALPAGERLHAVDVGYQPALFYIRAPLTYARRIDELPRDTRYFLIEPDDAEEALRSEQWSPRRPREVARMTDYRKKTVILFAVDGT